MFKLIFFDSIKISCESNSMAKHLNKYRNIAPEWNKYRKSHELFRIFLCLACLSIDSIGWIKCVPVSVLSTFICQKMLSAFALFDKWTDFTWFLYSDHRGSRRILRMFLMKKFQTYFCCLWFYSSLFPQFYSNSFYANNYKMARLYIEMEKKHRNEEKKNEKIERQARHCVERHWEKESQKLQPDSSSQNQHFTIPGRFVSEQNIRREFSIGNDNAQL